MTDLTGKTALVTGASRGIGRAIAVGLARAGADLALSARDEALLEEVRGEVEALGRRAVVLPADVTDADACAQLAADAIAGLGRLDVLVNNAGGSSYMGPFTELRFKGWEKTMRLNVDSIVHLSQAVGRHMVERKRGSIITIASIAAKVPEAGTPSYSVSKAGVWMLTKVMALELARTGVRVNAVGPGYTTTPMWDVPEDSPQHRHAMSITPMGRNGTPAEQAAACLFLASDESSFMTGQILHPAGGQFTD